MHVKGYNLLNLLVTFDCVIIAVAHDEFKIQIEQIMGINIFGGLKKKQRLAWF